MADKRTTSAAKEIHFDSYTPGPLDNAQDASEAFNSLAAEGFNEQHYANDNGEQTDRGTLREHAPRPEKDLRPTDEFSKVVDRETFDARQADENERAALKTEYLENAVEDYDEFLNGRDDPELGNDYDMGR